MQVKLNFLDKYYPYYEWLESDNIDIYKCELCKVTSKVINDLLFYNVKFNKTFSNKTIVFSDLYTSIAILFDSNAYSLKKSSLSLFDEEKIYKKIKNKNIVIVDYECINKCINDTSLRISSYIKEEIKNKLTSVNNDCDIINYLYYEWFNKKCIDSKKSFKEMMNRLENDITEKEYYIYDLINLMNK